MSDIQTILQEINKINKKLDNVTTHMVTQESLAASLKQQKKEILKAVDKKIDDRFRIADIALDKKLHDQFQAADAAWDKKLDNRFRIADLSLTEKLRLHAELIYQKVGEYLQGNIVPLLNLHEKQINKLERHTTHPPRPYIVE